MHYVYILQLQNGQRYVGYTTNLDDRMARHIERTACSTTERIPAESLEFYAAFHNELPDQSEVQKLALRIATIMPFLMLNSVVICIYEYLSDRD